MSRIDEIVAQARGAGIRPWIAIKETLARAVAREAAASEVGVLQGGAALHLAYGSPRLSADVDFVGRDVASVLEARGDALARAAGESVGCAASWSLTRSGRLVRGKIALDLGPGRKLVLPVEAYEVPAHAARRFPELGAVESPEEIAADKVVASADRLARRGTLKTTDLFDLWYIRVRLAAPLPATALVVDKARDYAQPARSLDLAAAARAVSVEELRGALAGVLPAVELERLPVGEVLDAAASVLDGFRDVL